MGIWKNIISISKPIILKLLYINDDNKVVYTIWVKKLLLPELKYELWTNQKLRMIGNKKEIEKNIDKIMKSIGGQQVLFKLENFKETDVWHYKITSKGTIYTKTIGKNSYRILVKNGNIVSAIKYIDDGEYPMAPIECDKFKKWLLTQKQSISRLDNIYFESVLRNDTEFIDALDELNSLNAKVRNYFKKFDISYRIKTFRDEKGAIAKIRDILQKSVEPKKVPDTKGDIVFKPAKTVGEIQQDIKDAVVKYSDGKPNFKDWQIKRVAVTETASMRILEKLIKWSDVFGMEQTVRHVAHIDSKTGPDSKAFNGSVFTIEFLMKNPEYRVPLRPNDRCDYRLSRESQHINPAAIQWVKGHGRK